MRKLTRRQWLRIAGYSGVLGMGLYAWKMEPHWIEIRHSPLPLKNLASNWVGKKIIQISDLHFGPIVNLDYLKSTFDSLKELKPDGIVVTGDWLDIQWSKSNGTARDLFDLIPVTPRGTVGILGNHDYGRRYEDESRAKLVIQTGKSLGFRMLRNESDNWEGLPVIGVDDLWGTRGGNYSDSVRGIDREKGQLILCHNPDGADLSIWDSVEGWMLSGHTHGGQISVPGYGPLIVPVVNTRYVQGHYPVRSGLDLWINRGLGYNMQVRFRARPEITCFTLEEA